MGSIRRTVVMRSFWSDPFLWIHLAGLAALPIWLGLCLLGLAVGDPMLPFWLEIGLVAIFGIAPILWMQWQRPFDIFSLLIVTVKPERLSDDQRRLLTLFKAQRNRFLAVLVSVGMLLVLQRLYNAAPIAASVAPFDSDSRSLGLLLAAIAFLGCNLFIQVPVSVLSVLLNTDATFAATKPFPVELIRRNFTLLGIPQNQILPPIVDEPIAAKPTVAESINAESINSKPEARSPKEVSNAAESSVASIKRQLSKQQLSQSDSLDDLAGDFWEGKDSDSIAVEQIAGKPIAEAPAESTSAIAQTAEALVDSAITEPEINPPETNIPAVESVEEIEPAAEIKAAKAIEPVEKIEISEEINTTEEIKQSESLIPGEVVPSAIENHDSEPPAAEQPHSSSPNPA